MNKILSQQHMCVPVWTQDIRERRDWSPDILVHVQVTVIRMRYASIFENDDERTSNDVLQPRRFAHLPEMPDELPAIKKPSPVSKTSKLASRRTPKKARRMPVIDDPRVNDPKFREKYMLN